MQFKSFFARSKVYKKRLFCFVTSKNLRSMCLSQFIIFSFWISTLVSLWVSIPVFALPYPYPYYSAPAFRRMPWTSGTRRCSLRWCSPRSSSGPAGGTEPPGCGRLKKREITDFIQIIGQTKDKKGLKFCTLSFLKGSTTCTIFSQQKQCTSLQHFPKYESCFATTATIINSQAWRTIHGYMDL